MFIKLSSEEVEKFEENFKFFNRVQEGDVLSWQEVSQIHRTQVGVYQKNGHLISLLTDFGKINPCYPDRFGETPNEIFYTGVGRKGNQKLDCFNRAVLNAIDSGHSIPLFRKLGVGRWEFMGFWRVTEGKYIFDIGLNRMVWKFKLVKVNKRS